MSNELQLGKIIDAKQKRDAVHVAIAPVVASKVLFPGQSIGFLGKSQELVTDMSNPVGIVDPFLKGSVQVDQRFWMWLFPGTVTSLRHAWSHPMFDDERPEVDLDIEGSKKWLRDYSRRVSPYEDEETAYKTLVDGLRGGELFYHGADLHSQSDVEDPDELKKHAKIVLGIDINWADFSFHCSC